MEDNLIHFTTKHILYFKECINTIESITPSDAFFTFYKKPTDKNKMTDNKKKKKSSSKKKKQDSDSDKKDKKKKRKLNNSSSDSDSDSEDDKKKKKRKLNNSSSDSDSEDDKKKKKDSESDSDDSEKEEEENNDDCEVQIRAINSSNSVAVTIHLLSSIFTKMKINLKNNALTCWLNVGDLNKFIKTVDSKEKEYELHMTVKKDDPKTIQFKAIHEEQREQYKSYEQPFVDNLSNVPNFEKVKPQFEIQTYTQTFKNICASMANHATTMTIECFYPNRTQFSCKTKANKPMVEAYHNDGNNIHLECFDGKNTRELRLSFVLENILKIKFPSKMCQAVHINVAKNKPMFLTSDIEQDEKILGRVTYWMSATDLSLQENYFEKTKDAFEDRKAIIKD